MYKPSLLTAVFSLFAFVNLFALGSSQAQTLPRVPSLPAAPAAPAAAPAQIEFGARSLSAMPYQAFGQWIEAVPALKDAVVQSGLSLEAVATIEIKPCDVSSPTPCAEIVGDPAKHTPNHMLFVGIQVGLLLYPVGVETVYEYHHDEKLRASADIRIEPSSYLNSYSFGAGIHPFKNWMFLGARVRKLQFKPGSEYTPDYYSPWAFGPELGARFGVVPSKTKNRVLGTVSLGMTNVPEGWPNEGLSIAPLYNVNVGLSYKVLH
jgi:hypothetical protein